MKKYFTWIFSILYIVVMGYVSYSVMPEITLELFNYNSGLLLGIGMVFNGSMLLITVFVMSFIFRIIYKIMTKETLDSKVNNRLTYVLLMPILATHAITLVLINVFSINSPLVLLLFLNPLIFILEYKNLDEKLSLKRITCLVPFFIYSIIDMINIYAGLFMEKINF